jgi:hypothetical protein
MEFTEYYPDGTHHKSNEFFNARTDSENIFTRSLIEISVPHIERRISRGLLDFVTIKLIPKWNKYLLNTNDFFDGNKDIIVQFEYEIWGKEGTVFSTELHLPTKECRIVLAKENDSDKIHTTLYVPKDFKEDPKKKFFGMVPFDYYVAFARGRKADIVWPWGDKEPKLGNGLGEELYYCGKEYGVDALPGSDGFCGPNNGPQCSSCRIYQYFKSREQYWKEECDKKMDPDERRKRFNETLYPPKANENENQKCNIS